MKYKKIDVDIKKLKKKFGSVKKFCESYGINYNTYKVVKSGNGYSKRVVEALKKENAIKEDIRLISNLPTLINLGAENGWVCSY